MDNTNSILTGMLREAIQSRNVEAVRSILLKNPKLLNLPDKNKVQGVGSPLWVALSSGYEEIVKLLVEFGANVNEWLWCDVYIEDYDRPWADKTSLKLTFLHWVAWTDKLEFEEKILEILIRHGVNLNASSDDVSTPLDVAVSRDNVEVSEFLLKNGAKIKDMYYVLNTLLQRRMIINKEILLLLVKYDLNALSFHNDTGENLLHSLHSPSETNDSTSDIAEIAEILLNAGVLLDEPNNDGITPLYYAVRYENYPLARFLVDKGANVNVKEKNQGLFPLLFAVRKNSFLMELLLDNGVEINAKTNSGWTALHEACSLYDCRDITVASLIARGASVSAEDENGKTPFSTIKFKLDNGEGEQCVCSVINEFARLKFEKLHVSEKDMKFIRENPRFLLYFEQCMDELSKMASTVFYTPYSFYSVLKMSNNNIKKLINLLKNDEFEKRLRENLYTFSCYDRDLRLLYLEALVLKERSSIVYSRLNSILGKFLPNVVIRKLAKNLNIKDLPL